VVALHIDQPGKPEIKMITEAGIIGKIGLNDAGVAVCLNAIVAPGVDFSKLPVHLALRSVLESTSLESARELLLKTSVASACHLTIADARSGAVGLECTSADVVLMEMEDGVTAHTNHLILPHSLPGIDLLKDSPVRLERIKELASALGPSAGLEDVAGLLKDEENYPTAICRSPGEDTIQTVFSIAMDCAGREARVKMGIPTKDGEEFSLSFAEAH
jgi:isopenicillin-N N-acyltransferase-like protein